MNFNTFQNNKILNNAKQAGWKLYKLTDLLKDDSRNALKVKKRDYIKEGATPIIDQGKELIGGYSNIENGFYTENSYIVFGDHTRILKYIDFPAFIGADGVKILKNINEEITFTKYLYYFLSTVSIPDTGYNRHFKFLKEVVIPVPKIEFQIEIVKLLDKINSIKNKRQQQIEALSALKQSIFLDMFGDPQLNTKKWAIGKIGDLTKKTQYGTSKKAHETNGAYPVLRMNNITYDGEMDLSDLKYVDLTEKEKDKYLVYPGEMLFNRTNSRELVGKTAVYKEKVPVAYAGYLVKLIPNTKGNSTFISGYLNSNYGKRYLFNLAKNSIGMSNINATELKNIPIYIPPIDLQNKYEDKIGHIDDKMDLLKKGLKGLEELYKSLLHKAFKGELFKEEDLQLV